MKSVSVHKPADPQLITLFPRRLGGRGEGLLWGDVLLVIESLGFGAYKEMRGFARAFGPSSAKEAFWPEGHVFKTPGAPCLARSSISRLLGGFGQILPILVLCLMFIHGYPLSSRFPLRSRSSLGCVQRGLCPRRPGGRAGSLCPNSWVHPGQRWDLMVPAGSCRAVTTAVISPVNN